jgi:predicted CoA-binding protein
MVGPVGFNEFAGGNCKGGESRTIDVDADVSGIDLMNLQEETAKEEKAARSMLMQMCRGWWVQSDLMNLQEETAKEEKAARSMLMQMCRGWWAQSDLIGLLPSHTVRFVV